MIYIVWHYYNNGCDVWKTLQSVWNTQSEAETAEINLTLTNGDPSVYYDWEMIEIGRDYD